MSGLLEVQAALDEAESLMEKRGKSFDEVIAEQGNLDDEALTEVVLAFAADHFTDPHAAAWATGIMFGVGVGLRAARIEGAVA